MIDDDDSPSQLEPEWPPGVAAHGVVLEDLHRFAHQFLRSGLPVERMAQRVAVGALARVEGLLAGVILMGRAGLAYEVNALARLVLEIGFVVGWIGRDAKRAGRFYDDAVLSGEFLFETWKTMGVKSTTKAERYVRRRAAGVRKRHGIAAGERKALGPGGKKMNLVPTFQELAKETRIGTKKRFTTLEQNYQLNYRRLCLFAHCDPRTLFAAARFEQPAELPMALVEAIAAAVIAIELIASSLRRKSMFAKLRSEAVAQIQKIPSS